MTCDSCNRPAETKGAILNNKFGQYCANCRQEAARLATGQSAQWHRDRDHEDHRRDLIQPKTPQGKINPEFLRAYPEESAEMFTQEDIEQTLHNS